MWSIMGRKQAGDLPTEVYVNRYQKHKAEKISLPFAGGVVLNFVLVSYSFRFLLQ